MKITAQNLRGIGAPQSFDITRNTYISGRNGAGKSTLATVPYYVLTGKGLSAKNGTSESLAAITIGGDTITRCRQGKESKLFLNGKAITSNVLEQELALRNLHYDVLTALFDCHTRLTGSDLLKVANMRLDIDTVCSYIDFESMPLAEEMLRTYLKELNVPVVDVPVVQKAEKHFVELRKEKKKEIKTQQAVIDDLNVDDTDYSALMTTFEQEIAALREKVGQEKGKLASVWQNNELIIRTQDSLSASQDQLKSIESELASKPMLEEQKAELQKKEAALSQLIAILTKDEENLRSHMEENNRTISDQNAKKSALEAKISEKKKIVNTLTTTTVCPLYAGISCTVNKNSVIEQIQEEIRSLEEELCEVEKDQSLTLTANRGVKEEYDITIASIRNHQHDQQDIRQSLQKTELALNSLSGKEDMKATLEQNIKLAEESLSHFSVQDGSAIKQNIAELQNQLNEKSAFQRDLAVKISAQEKKKVLLKVLLENVEKNNAYDFLVNELRLLPNLIFSKIVGPLQNTADEIMATMKPDWKIKFEVDGNKPLVFVETENGVINIDELSTGEELLVNYLLKAIVCRLTNFDVIILDNIDSLDEEGLSALAQAIKASTVKTICFSPRKAIPKAFDGLFFDVYCLK